MLKIEGNIVTKDRIFRGRIEIDDHGKINKIGEPEGNADFVFGEELIFPGFIDLHVHARECADHSQDYKEDFQTAGLAAINGGVVAFADMPNNPTSPIDKKSYAQKEKLAQKCPVDVVLYAGIGVNTAPLAKRVPYKVFMGPSVGDLFFNSRIELEQAIAKYHGQYVSFHCEDPEIMNAHKDAPTHETKRPVEAEISAVDFAISLIEKYDIIGKICHCSTIEGITKIIEARARGLKITAEITPHHLFYDQEMLGQISTEFQVNPPIRQTKTNRLALIKMLKEGRIDYLATDHAPHSQEEKAKGTSGLTHLDTFCSFTSWLIKEHDFSPSEIMRVCARNPGNFFSEFASGQYGEIKEGYVGSLTVLDLSKKFKVESSKLKTKNKWSPFLGVTFPGSVVLTVVRGIPYQNEFGTGQEPYENK
jgi:dihydroorotase